MKLKLYSTVFLLPSATGIASADFIVSGFSSNNQTIDLSIQLIGTGIMVSFIAIILLATATWITLVCIHSLELIKKGKRQRCSAQKSGSHCSFYDYPSRKLWYCSIDDKFVSSAITKNGEQSMRHDQP